MTTCTQPACTGTIVDGYCDVCGSPADALPFIPAVAAASAAAPALAVRTGQTAGHGGSGFPARPRDCTQRGCGGTIVDGYCDVCGSPAGAPPFVPALAAAQYTNVAEEESPTQRIPRVQITTELPSAREMADPVAADPEVESPTQRIPRVQMTTELPSAREMADPVAADPEVESPTQRIPRVQMTTELPSAREMADPVAADPEVESPTQRIPRVKVPTQQLSINEMADQATAHHPALVAQKLDGEKALAEDQPNGARDYRTRVEGAELPDDVRKAALCEVGKLERTSDQSPESVDIRTWLDTILDLPWGTKTTDWIDIQGSREVEATLRRLIEPAAGDVEDGDAAEVEVVAGEVGEGDAAEVEVVAGEVGEGDAAEVEVVAGEVGEGDAAEVEAVAGEVGEGDAAEVEVVAGEVGEGDAAEVEGRRHCRG